MRNKKKTFVLLEIVIAIALVSISILPFIRHPYSHMKQEIETLFEMELVRVAASDKVQLQIDLARGLIPTEILDEKKQTKNQFDWHRGSQIQLELPGGLKRTYHRATKFSRALQKEGSDESRYYLANFYIGYRSPKDKRKNRIHTKTQLLVQKKD